MSCIHCNKDTMADFFDGDGIEEPHVYMMNGVVYMEHDCVIEEVPINFCPVCGERFESEVQE